MISSVSLTKMSDFGSNSYGYFRTKSEDLLVILIDLLHSIILVCFAIFFELASVLTTLRTPSGMILNSHGTDRVLMRYPFSFSGSAPAAAPAVAILYCSSSSFLLFSSSS